MKMSEYDDAILLLECAHCQERTMVRPTGARLELMSNGLMVLRYFCLHCYELTIGRISDPDWSRPRCHRRSAATNVIASSTSSTRVGAAR